MYTHISQFAFVRTAADSIAAFAVARAAAVSNIIAMGGAIVGAVPGAIAIAVTGVFVVAFSGAVAVTFVFAVAFVFAVGGDIAAVFAFDGALAAIAAIHWFWRKSNERQRQGIFLSFFIPAMVLVCLGAADLLSPLKSWDTQAPCCSS